MRSFRVLKLSLLALALFAAPGAAQSGTFGNATVLNGDDLIVAEPNNNFRPGVVYVYRKAGSGWTEAAQLMAPDAERADGFGTALAASGNTLFVAQSGGRVHAFEKTGNTWTFSGTLPDVGITDLDRGCNYNAYCGTDFGITLATDGTWLLVGQAGVQIEGTGPGARPRSGGTDAPPPPAGAVYAFRRGNDGSWSHTQTFESPATASGDAFGASIVIAGGRTLIGAPRAARASSGDTNQGEILAAGRVFEFQLEGGSWERGVELAAGGEADARYGSAIALEGDVAVIGAPGSGGGFGAAFLFRRDGSAWSEASRLTAFSGQRGDRFGAAVALDGEDVWVGAPVARGFETGMAYVFSGLDGTPIQSSPRQIRFDEFQTNTQDVFGHRVVAAGGVAAVTATGLDHAAGGVFVYERDSSGDWRDSGLLVSAPDALGAVMGEERRCTDGAVDVFDCQDIELLSYVPISLLRADGDTRGIRANDNWGWTDPQTGREYALVGRNDGTSFIDITDPTNPVLVGDLPKTPNTPRSQLWRDIKTYRDHAYIVADGAGEHGMQVFDLTRLRDVTDMPALFEPDLLYRGEGANVVESTHNIMINEETGFAYLTNRACAGMHIVNIQEPMNPTFEGCSDPGGVHDAQCIVYRGPDDRYRGREICLRMSGSVFQISDVTDKANPVELANASHPNPAYMHQGWVTEDHRYFYMDDESDVIAGNVATTRTLIWDLSDLEDPLLAEEFMGSMPASAHNLYIKDDIVYQANYRYGLHILDASDPLNPVEVGHFDTSPYQTGPGFAGAWSTYPFFESGSILVTSMQEGLFVLKKRVRPIS